MKEYRDLFKKKNNCKMCGKCCEVIQLPWSKEEIAKINPVFPYDKIFILNHFTEISLSDFARLYPYKHIYNKHLYLCDWFDRENNRCMHQNLKPPVCEDYPEYGNVNYTYRDHFYGNVYCRY